MPVGANPVLGPGPATSGGVGDVDPELAAAIAASLEPNSAAVPANAAAVSAPAPPPETEVEAEADWPEPLPDAMGEPGAVVLAIRLASGSRFQRGYPSTATLHQVFCAVHHCSGQKLKARKYQLTTMGSPPFYEPTATLASLGLVGRLAVNLAEAA